MDAITMYGIKSCGSVQKARKFLEARGIAYEFIDLKTTPLESSFVEWLAQETSGEAGDILLNTKGATYKKLGLKDLSLSPEQKIQAMLKHPLLIKRPVILYTKAGKKQVLVGFDEDRFVEAFGND